MYRIDPLIYIGQAIIGQAKPAITGKQVCIVTQKSLPQSIITAFSTLLHDKSVQTVFVPEGEAAKSWETVEELCDKLIEAKFNRECTIIALGGGVVGDVAGFVASIFLRGVNFIQVPTSLLAQVDASVGGKTAINHAQGKNLIGSFYPAKSVIIDIEHLKTLPERDFVAGLAEVVKIACVRDAEFFAWLENNVENILAREPEALTHMIYQAVKLKAEIVKLDEKEQGLRMLLNFGHTLAHAIEAASEYHWLHGEAVSVGMVNDAMASQAEGLSEQSVQRLVALLQYFGLPTQLPESLAVSVKAFTPWDKKQRDEGLNQVLITEIGHGIIKMSKKHKVAESA